MLGVQGVKKTLHTLANNKTKVHTSNNDHLDNTYNKNLNILQSISDQFGNIDMASLSDLDITYFSVLLKNLDSVTSTLECTIEGHVGGDDDDDLWKDLIKLMEGEDSDEFEKCKQYIMDRRHYFETVSKNKNSFTQIFVKAFLDCSVNILKQVFSLNFTPTTWKLQKDL